MKTFSYLKDLHSLSHHQHMTTPAISEIVMNVNNCMFRGLKICLPNCVPSCRGLFWLLHSNSYLLTRQTCDEQRMSHCRKKTSKFCSQMKRSPLSIIHTFFQLLDHCQNHRHCQQLTDLENNVNIWKISDHHRTQMFEVRLDRVI